MADAVSSLPDRDRFILVLSYYEGLTLAEIGSILDLTESRVCQLRHAGAQGAAPPTRRAERLRKRESTVTCACPAVGVGSPVAGPTGRWPTRKRVPPGVTPVASGVTISRIDPAAWTYRQVTRSKRRGGGVQLPRSLSTHSMFGDVDTDELGCRPGVVEGGHGEVDRGDSPSGRRRARSPRRRARSPASRARPGYIADLGEEVRIRWAKLGDFSGMLSQGLRPAPFPGAPGRTSRRYVAHPIHRQSSGHASCPLGYGLRGTHHRCVHLMTQGLGPS